MSEIRNSNSDRRSRIARFCRCVRPVNETDSNSCLSIRSRFQKSKWSGRSASMHRSNTTINSAFSRFKIGFRLVSSRLVKWNLFFNVLSRDVVSRILSCCPETTEIVDRPITIHQIKQVFLNRLIILDLPKHGRYDRSKRPR